MRSEPLPALLRPAEVCRILGVSRSWLYQAAADGRIPAVRLGGQEGPVRFDPEELDRWLARARSGWRPLDTGAETLRRVQGERRLRAVNGGQERLDL